MESKYMKLPEAYKKVIEKWWNIFAVLFFFALYQTAYIAFCFCEQINSKQIKVKNWTLSFTTDYLYVYYTFKQKMQ